MGAIKKAALFVWDFLVGDDWLIAVLAIAGILITWGIAGSAFPGWLVMPAVAVVILAVSLRRATPLPRTRRSDEP
jgi:hypothetical protein